LDLSSEFHDVMTRLPSGVTIVSTRGDGGVPLGTTSSAVAFLSRQPPFLLVAIDRERDREIIAGIRATGKFTVNFLGEQQRALSSRFLTEGGAARATGLDLLGKEGEAPHLADASVTLRCSLDRHFEAGDHDVVIGEVVGLRVAEADSRPLVSFRGQYSRLYEGDMGSSGGQVEGKCPRENDPTVVIVGGGFSGAMMAAHLLRRPHPNRLRIVVIEREPKVGRGIAYSTPYLAHRLNVPAGQMSAYPSEPDHFLRWARARDRSVGPGSFVPRFFYGDYIEETLAEAEKAAGPDVHLERFHDEAIGISEVEVPHNRRFVRLRSGREVAADRVVIASGNAAPAAPDGLDPELLASDRYVADPWSHPTAVDDSVRSIALLGTGLTMVDSALTLATSTAQPELHAISRHGLLPRPHLDHAGPAAQHSELALGGDLAELVPQVLVDAATASDHGFTWRQVIDSVRPFSNQIWGELPEEQRRWFMTHLARLWEVHRHRMAPEVAMALATLRADGRLRITAASLERASLRKDGVEIKLRMRSGEKQTIFAERLINCTGPTSDVTAAANPFLDDLLATGLVRPDPLRLGLEIDNHGAVLNAAGEVSDSIFTIGPLRKGRLWETTAIPELRAQAEDLADHFQSLRPLAAARLSSG
jgi:uncharacterized NAD(P)/FAD-binding protein YdhS/flavin reductase (DIM6/NTAB) family NADH-FMN oxidoreductase RutF